MKLFMFYVGGDCANSNIEVHDIRFAAGAAVEDCYPDLRRQWWGTPNTLHIDSWGEVAQADGYDVKLGDVPTDSDRKLFFLNVGGYSGVDFEEMHKNILLVDATPHKAIHRALMASREWRIPHKDSIFEIEKIISISDVLRESGLHLQLTPANDIKPFAFVSKYLRIHE